MISLIVIPQQIVGKPTNYCFFIYFRLRNNKALITIVFTSVLFLYILVNSKGPHRDVVQAMYKQILWCLYWIGLGRNLKLNIC